MLMIGRVRYMVSMNLGNSFAYHRRSRIQEQVSKMHFVRVPKCGWRYSDSVDGAEEQGRIGDIFMGTG